jgi:hypothetical protein
MKHATLSQYTQMKRPIVRRFGDAIRHFFDFSRLPRSRSTGCPSAFHKYSTFRRNDVIHYHYRGLFYRIIDGRNIDIPGASGSSYDKFN